MPALNKLLKFKNITFSDQIVKGVNPKKSYSCIILLNTNQFLGNYTVSMPNGDQYSIRIGSASTITRVPVNSLVWMYNGSLHDEATHIVLEEQRLNGSRANRTFDQLSISNRERLYF